MELEKERLRLRETSVSWRKLMTWTRLFSPYLFFRLNHWWVRQIPWWQVKPLTTSVNNYLPSIIPLYYVFYGSMYCPICWMWMFLNDVDPLAKNFSKLFTISKKNLGEEEIKEMFWYTYKASIYCSVLSSVLPDEAIVDEGSQFRMDFGEVAAVYYLNLGKSCVEDHNSLGTSESYVKFLREQLPKTQVGLSIHAKITNSCSSDKAYAWIFRTERNRAVSIGIWRVHRLRSLSEPVLHHPSLVEHTEASQQPSWYEAQHWRTT